MRGNNGFWEPILHQPTHSRYTDVRSDGFVFGMPSVENFSMVISVEIGQQQMFGFVTICQKFPFQIVFIALGKRFAEKFAQQLMLFAW